MNITVRATVELNGYHLKDELDRPELIRLIMEIDEAQSDSDFTDEILIEIMTSYLNDVRPDHLRKLVKQATVRSKKIDGKEQPTP